MAVDHYALCPCGSGKKIKFCKCASSIDELDKVMKMVSGGQMVAALDRLNQILNDHPDAAWALAVKGRLLISLHEYDSVAANAERFIRLQPSNPLALAQKSAAQVFRGDTLPAARSLLEALGESGRSIDAFLLEIASVLALGLARTGNVFSARLFATLPLTAPEFEEADLAQQVLMELNRSSAVNLLMKTLPTPIKRPEKVDWAERFDEAQSLLHSNQILLAESKFEGLDRQFAGQPAILSGLLTCAIWRADSDAQARLLKKLSDALTDDLETAARMRATAGLIAGESSDFAARFHDLQFEIDDAEQATMALTSQSRFRSLPPETLREAFGEDGVPPKAAFHLLDKEPLDENVERPGPELVPTVQGTVLVFGRQTDRGSRLLVTDLYDQTLSEVSQLIQSTVGCSEPSSDDVHPVPVTSLVFPRLYLMDRAKLASDEDWVGEVFKQRIPETILSAKLPAFQDRSAAEVADDDSTLRDRTALIRLLEGISSASPGMAEGIKVASDKLGVTELSTVTPTSDDELEALTAFDLQRVDPSQLDTEGLTYLFQRCQQSSCAGTLMATAERMVASQDAKLEPELVQMAYLTLVRGAASPEKATEILEKAKQWCAANNVSDGNILMTELQLHLRAGNAEAFERTIQTLFTKHGNDQYLMAQLQQMLVQLGLINPDGSPRSGPGPAAAAQQGGPELWTGGPDSSGGAAPAGPASMPSPESAAPPASGGSKLWLPGMD